MLLNRFERREKTQHRLLQVAQKLPVSSGEDPLAARDLVRKMVSRSPPTVRTAAWLYHVDGMKQDAIAAVLGVSRRTIVNRLHEFGEICRKFLQGAKRTDSS